MPPPLPNAGLPVTDRKGKKIDVFKKYAIARSNLRRLRYGLAFQVSTVDAAPAPLTAEKERPEETGSQRSSGKWLPLPIFLTEPAFGYGFGLGLGYIHPKTDDIETEAVPSLQTPKAVWKTYRKPTSSTPWAAFFSNRFGSFIETVSN